MPLFEFDPESHTVKEIASTTFPALHLWERQHLEAWVETAPAMAGGDFTVVTTEFDRFDRTSERLDVLGVVRLEDAVGRLVVVELKREGSSTTVDLQAIKYAAYIAAAQFSDVVEMHATYHKQDEAESRETLLRVLGGSEDDPPLIDDTPRIVLVAGDFRPEVTTTVLWLIDNFDVDIRCVRLQPFVVGERIVISSEILIPLPAAEQYRSGVRRKRKDAERERTERLARDGFSRGFSKPAHWRSGRRCTSVTMPCPMTTARPGQETSPCTGPRLRRAKASERSNGSTQTLARYE